MSMLTAAAAIAFSTALILFLAGFVRIAEAVGAGPMSRIEIAVGGVHILGATAIWFFALGVVGGAL